MVDPITAVGLACNVIQLLELGYKGVNCCWEIYKDGKDLRTSTLQDISQHLDNVCAHVQGLSTSSATVQTPGLAGSNNLKSLHELSIKCQATAKLLQHELQKLIIAPHSNPLVVVGTALKAVKKVSKIQKLKEQLDSYREILNTQLLVELRYDIPSRSSIRSKIKPARHCDHPYSGMI